MNKIFKRIIQVIKDYLTKEGIGGIEGIEGIGGIIEIVAYIIVTVISLKLLFTILEVI